MTGFARFIPISFGAAPNRNDRRPTKALLNGRLPASRRVGSIFSVFNSVGRQIHTHPDISGHLSAKTAQIPI